MARDLARRPILSTEEIEARNARRAAVATRRQQQLRRFLDSIAFDSVHDVNLRKHAGKTDADLDVEIAAGRMTVEDAWKVKEWRKPKKSIAYAIEAANQHVVTTLKREGEKPSVKINVENATIQLPEKRDETVAPVYIDVVSDK